MFVSPSAQRDENQRSRPATGSCVTASVTWPSRTMADDEDARVVDELAGAEPGFTPGRQEAIATRAHPTLRIISTVVGTRDSRAGCRSPNVGPRPGLR